MVLDSSDIVLGNWDPATEGETPFNAVEITTRRSTANGNRPELFLAPVLGLGWLDMEAGPSPTPARRKLGTWL